MNEQLAIYLWSISEGLCGYLVGLSLLGCIGGGITAFIGFTTSGCRGVSEDMTKNIYRYGKNAFIVGLLIGGMTILIPSKQDLALIFTYPTLKSGVTTAINSKQMQKLNKASILYLDKVIKDLEKQK